MRHLKKMWNCRIYFVSTVDFQENHFANTAAYVVLCFAEVLAFAVFADVDEMQRTVVVLVYIGIVQEVFVFARLFSFIKKYNKRCNIFLGFFLPTAFLQVIVGFGYPSAWQLRVMS